MSGPAPETAEALTPITGKDQLVRYLEQGPSRATSGASVPSTKSSPSSPTRFSRCPISANAPSRPLLHGL